MNRIAQFEKVSFDEYLSAYKKNYPNEIVDENVVRKEWEEIKVPTRATAGSAGYDFYMPHFEAFRPHQNRFFPTGIRCKIEPGWVLICCPKSGLGSRYNMRLVNTIGVVDSDYYYSDNEGHIMAGFSVGKGVDLMKGDKFMQGVLVPFGITTDDDATGVRNGGFGSTGLK